MVPMVIILGIFAFITSVKIFIRECKAKESRNWWKLVLAPVIAIIGLYVASLQILGWVLISLFT